MFTARDIELGCGMDDNVLTGENPKSGFVGDGGEVRPVGGHAAEALARQQTVQRVLEYHIAAINDLVAGQGDGIQGIGGDGVVGLLGSAAGIVIFCRQQGFAGDGDGGGQQVGKLGGCFVILFRYRYPDLQDARFAVEVADLHFALHDLHDGAGKAAAAVVTQAHFLALGFITGHIVVGQGCRTLTVEHGVDIAGVRVVLDQDVPVPQDTFHGIDRQHQIIGIGAADAVHILGAPVFGGEACIILDGDRHGAGAAAVGHLQPGDPAVGPHFRQVGLGSQEDGLGIVVLLLEGQTVPDVYCRRNGNGRDNDDDDDDGHQLHQGIAPAALLSCKFPLNAVEHKTVSFLFGRWNTLRSTGPALCKKGHKNPIMIDATIIPQTALSGQ